MDSSDGQFFPGYDALLMHQAGGVGRGYEFRPGGHMPLYSVAAHLD